MKISLNIPASRATLTAALEGLTAVNVVYLRANPRTPSLYSSGVRYRRESPGREKWLTIPQVISAGIGDCEDLATYLAAQLQVAGIDARAVVVRTGPKTFHAVVRLPGGKIEDPSAKLGMMKRKRK